MQAPALPVLDQMPGGDRRKEFARNNDPMTREREMQCDRSVTGTDRPIAGVPKLSSYRGILLNG